MATIDKRRLILLGGFAGIFVLGAGFMINATNNAEPPPPPAPVEPQIIEVEVSEIKVLAATRDLIRGDVLQSTDFLWINWPESASTSILFDQDNYPQATVDLAGRAVLEPIFAGEPITQNRLLGVEGGAYMSNRVREGYRAFAMSIDAFRGVSGFVLPNDRVDLVWVHQQSYVNPETGNGGSFLTAENILENVRVISVNQVARETDVLQDAIIANSVNVEVTPVQAEILALAANEGTIYYTLRGVLDSNENGGDPITIIDPIQERLDQITPEEGEEIGPNAPTIIRNGREEGS